MIRFFQNNQGTIDFLQSESIEDMIIINEIDSNIYPKDLSVLWLKIKYKDFWLRFFLDAGFCFGEQYNLAEFKNIYWEDIDCSFSSNFSDRFNLKNLTIISAIVIPLNLNQFISINGVEFSLSLNSQETIRIWSDVMDGMTKISLSNKYKTRHPKHEPLTNNP